MNPDHRRRLLAVVGLIAAGAGIALRASRDDSPADPAATALAQQRWVDTGGKPFDVAQLRGRIAVLNFWATWCPPCLAEMPLLSQLADELRPQRVEFIGVGIDRAEAIDQFSRRVPVGYRLLVAGMGAVQILGLLGNESGSLPFTLILAKDGSIKHTILGPVDGADLRAKVLRLTR